MVSGLFDFMNQDLEIFKYVKMNNGDGEITTDDHLMIKTYIL